MYSVNVVVSHSNRNKVFVLPGGADAKPHKDLRDQLIVGLESEHFKLKAKLGDVDVDITNEEEFQVLYAYHEGSGLPLQVTATNTQDDQKHELKFAEPADYSLIWVGNAPHSLSKNDFLRLVSTALGGEQVSVGLFEEAAGGSELRFGLIQVSSLGDSVALQNAVKKIASVETGDGYLKAVPANAVKPVETLSVVSAKSPKHAKKNRKGSKARRVSVTSAPLLLKAWKAEYLKRACRVEFGQVAASCEVQLSWTSPTAVNMTGKPDAVKEARKALERLLEGVQALGQLTIPCPDSSFKIRVINQCRVLEKELGIVLIIDNLISPKADDSKEETSTIVTVMVVGNKKAQFEDAKKKLTAIPKQMFEIKCTFTKKEVEEFKKIRQSKAAEISAIKKSNKVYVLKAFKGRLVMKGVVLDALHKAEREIKALLPALQVPEAGGLRVSFGGDFDSFVPLSSPHSADMNASGRIEIDINEIRALNPKAEPELLSSPSSGTMSSPAATSPISLHSGDEARSKPVEIADDELVPEETVELKEDDEAPAAEPEENDPDLPDTWDYMPGDVNCVAALVEPNSEEFNMVKNSLDFVPASIKTIERIQNKNLYREFQAAKQNYASKGKSTETSYLWCGTMASPPEEVYESKEGFNLQVDGQAALQFWKKASYCNVFAYSTVDGSKQLFLAEVLAGKTKMQVKGVPAYPAYLLTLKMKAN
eukprot:TRINITY_DN1596_c0_g1_i2.p1 TRINITY_DN1596_c0_g1~~TRINITY_DN1596_c0_g1_i2.p1  ORF type:complete len:742 (+),score=248.42 TRINITY_DN1596_c0_g1_i2:108-2228(+)